MTPLLPSPNHYLHNLITMTSSESKRLWRRAIKQHFNCQCVYCGENYELHELTLDHVKPRSKGGQDLTKMWCVLAGNAMRTKVAVTGLDGVVRHLDSDLFMNKES